MISAFQPLRETGFEIELLHHAEAIISVDFPEAVEELCQTLAVASIPIAEIVGSGGGEAKGTQRLRKALAALDWKKGKFEIRKTINGIERESISHEVDHVRRFAGGHAIALEIEWNNKDPFFDRDLENFKRLHAEGAISIGIIVTRGSSLQDQLLSFVRAWAERNAVDDFDALGGLGITPTSRQRAEVLKRVQRSLNPVPFREAWAEHFISDKFGAATTHWSKLMDRVRRGVGNPCPLILIGLPASLVKMD